MSMKPRSWVLVSFFAGSTLRVYSFAYSRNFSCPVCSYSIQSTPGKNPDTHPEYVVSFSSPSSQVLGSAVGFPSMLSARISDCPAALVMPRSIIDSRDSWAIRQAVASRMPLIAAAILLFIIRYVFCSFVVMRVSMSVRHGVAGVPCMLRCLCRGEEPLPRCCRSPVERPPFPQI